MKKSVEDFIEFLEDADIQEFTGDASLQNFLDKNYPEWREIVRTPENWQCLERFVERQREFVRAMLQAGGGRLVSRWFNSKNRDIRDTTMIWLQDLSWGEVEGMEVTKELWSELSGDVKQYIIEHLFSTEIEEAHEFYRMLFNIVEEDCIKLQEKLEEEGASSPINIVLPPVGYVPSFRIRRLITTIEKAGDKKFLDLIEKFIEERKAAYNRPLIPLDVKSIWNIYLPTGFQRRVTTPLLKKFVDSGFVLSKVPHVYISLEVPPAMLLFPEGPEPQEVAMEELFGFYDGELSITIYESAVRWFSMKRDIDMLFLRAIVFLYGMCGWAIQRLEKPELPQWYPEHYWQSPLIVRGTLAYLLTEKVVEKIGGELKDTFKEVKAFLTQIPLSIYDRLKTALIEQLIEKICTLRSLNRPASINDLLDGL